MFQLSAPYPLVQTTSNLPNPAFGDGENITSTVSMLRAMDGTRYTYIRRKGGRRKLQWSFTLSRNKALELRAFIQSYFASKIKVTDHNGHKWVGNFTSNPFEFDTPSRSAPTISPMPRGESQTITIEFEGVEQ